MIERNENYVTTDRVIETRERSSQGNFVIFVILVTQVRFEEIISLPRKSRVVLRSERNGTL